MSGNPRKAPIRLSGSQARQLALKAQGLADDSIPNLKALSETLGAIQLDTISVLARSHELIPYARLGAIGRDTIENHYWSERTATHFEFWSHAACIIPVHHWGLYSFKREHGRKNPPSWHELTSKQLSSMLKRIEAEGPVSTTDVGGGRKSAYWWDWSENKAALEHLLITGDLTVTRRVGFRRMYDIPSRAIPKKYFKDVPAHEGKLALLLNAMNALGVATKLDLHDYLHFKPTHHNDVWEDFLTHVIPVEVEGWDEPAFTTKHWLSQLTDDVPGRVTLLSPFDSLIWYRPRLERLFSMYYRIEAYTPAAKRVYGYFAMPVLVGDELVARVDPGREVENKETVLIAKLVTFESTKPSRRHIEGVASALREAATWVNASSIRVDGVVPSSAAATLRKLVN